VPEQGSAKVPFGDGAGIRVGGVEVALISRRIQAFGTEIFTALGIDLSTKRYVGVKSTNHFHAAYAPIAAKVLYCEGGGPSPLDARHYPFAKITRPLWPHDELPEGCFVV
jgi:microcystin degradation protein MlrC